MIKEPLASDFLELVEENKKLIYKVSHMYCDNIIDKADLFQEIVANIWEAYPNFKGNSKTGTWIYRISLNTAISWFREYTKNRKHIQYTSIIPQIHEDCDTDELNDKLYHAINILEKIDKAIILLQLDGYSYEEISEIVGLTKTNVATKINRIKQKLKNHMSNS